MKGIENGNFDAIVVGSGPGGATVSRELALKGKKVLILEWGSDRPLKGTMLQAMGMAFVPGRSALITRGGLVMVRGIGLGGSSSFNYATIFDPPFKMLKSYGIDISKEVKETLKELPHDTLSDELVGPMAARIMESAQDLGYDWQKLPKFIYQDKCRENCDKCTFGCPYDAKWSARMYIHEALRKGAQLISGAKVTKVIVDKNKAVGVEFRKGGQSFKAFAPEIIVSAGGIGSPKILRASGIMNAGYDFFYDPLIFVEGSVKGIKGGYEVPMATGIHMEDEGYIMTDLTLPRILYFAFSAEVLRFDRLFSHSRSLSIMVKAKDGLSGRLTDSGGVRKGLTDADKKKLMKGYDRAKGILKNAGAGNIYKTWYIAAHPGGTVKVNDVIDSNLKTEYDNLYVCDCSVIPDAWGRPPTLTIISLGKRLAKHLTVHRSAGKKANAESKKKRSVKR